MISKLTLLAAAVLLTTNADAQLGASKRVMPNVTLGAKAGVNMQHTRGNNLSDSYEPGWMGGAFFSLAHDRNGVRVEALVKSATIEYSTTATHYRSLCLDVPVMYEYSLLKRVHLQVGPQLTMRLSAKKSGTEAKSDLSSMDVAAAGGVEVMLPKKFTAGARFIKGFLDMNKNIAGAGKWKTSTFQFTVGYRFLD